MGLLLGQELDLPCAVLLDESDFSRLIRLCLRQDFVQPLKVEVKSIEKKSDHDVSVSCCCCYKHQKKRDCYQVLGFFTFLRAS